ncbi:reverse transcriptase domain-containing protein [Chishuiella sp.]|uniref:reverse transcriptase domain-containing protein n=1 Tax=Chishuiella sp. TaxID=1969467 RepID=UPI0028AE7595|nr:reverse transcriptase domain-containing protein [Chishuiella sp.]
MNEIINRDQVFSAYKKLKHYYYYDNSSILIKKRIAVFENETFKDSDNISDLKNKLYDKVKEYFNSITSSELLSNEDIKITLLPKKISDDKLNINTNNFKAKDQINVDRLNIYIDAPIEVHILSLLWLMYVARFLENEISDNSYANKLDLNIDLNDQLPYENFKIYKPYFVQYQLWRDEAIKKAETLLDEKKNVTILSLDIKDYYHNIVLDLSDLNDVIELKIEKYFENTVIKENKVEKFIESGIYLNNLLSNIHQIYYKKAEKYLSNNKEEISKHPLPIGLISSGFLANYYLKDFDKKILQEVNPAFYGRYVDDLMFVFSDLNQHINEKLVSPTISFVDKIFVKKEIFSIDSNVSLVNEILLKNLSICDNKEEILRRINEKFLKLNEDPNFSNIILNNLLDKLNISFNDSISNTLNYSKLKIQSSKVVLHYFDFKESRAVLNIFKSKLEEQRSEFRFLPDEDEISNDFDEEAFDLKYGDSVNKFRSIQDLSENKYGASKFLAKKIFAISFGRKDNDETTDKQILTFFKGNVGISFYTLWEKVIIYYVIGEKLDLLLQFRRNILAAISKIDHVNFKEQIKEDLRKYLDVATASSFCLNPTLLEKFNFLTDIEKKDLLKISSILDLLLKSNLFRTSLISLPIVNFTKIDLKTFNLIDNDFTIFQKDNKETFELNEYKTFLSPYYTHFHDINIFKIFQTLSNIKQDASFIDINDNINKIPEESFIEYYKINYSWKTKVKKKDIVKEKYFEIIKYNTEDHNYVNVNNISVKGEAMPYEEVDKKIAIANLKVSDENIKSSILKKPNLNRERRKEIFDLINKADSLKSDLTIFPEVSIPFSWLKLLAERSHKRYMGIVAGLEHWINIHNVAFNFIATVLPFRVNDYTTSLIKVRLKNHYSPGEIEMLKGYRLFIPQAKSADEKKAMGYDLFHWRKVYFSVYNCFELANIQHRSIFKSKVDFIIASELNKDTDYFSDIAGAWVRDVHSYFIQVNTSNYGDSRLLQPSKSYKKDLIQVKGGVNSTVLVDNLEINKLRDFQYMEYNLQKDFVNMGKYDFKPTPPDFNRDNVLKRMEDGEF